MSMESENAQDAVGFCEIKSQDFFQVRYLAPLRH